MYQVRSAFNVTSYARVNENDKKQNSRVEHPFNSHVREHNQGLSVNCNQHSSKSITNPAEGSEQSAFCANFDVT
jgi:hypothetical protein